MNEEINNLRQLLISRQGLLITAEAYTSAVMDVFPLNGVVNCPAKQYDKVTMDILHTLEEEYPGYSLTTEYSSEDIDESSIAYHRIFGFITSSSHYFFSSKQFEQDLLAAEENPAIACHFIHINSGGGEGWYLDRLSETIASIKKPSVVLIERICASAAYYIGCQFQHIFSLTDSDMIGCIGTMVDFYDWDAYYAKLGLKRITVRASKSDLKNKMYDDLVKGKPDEYVNRILDPINEQFLEIVRRNRPLLTDVEETEPALRGETFLTPSALDKGLIDGKKNLQEILLYARELANKWSQKNSVRKKALNIFNS